MRRKRVLNFRLSHDTVNILTSLEKKLHVTKTAAVEAALHEYASHKLASTDELLAYAGMLKEDEGKAMLKHIRKNRHNKKRDLSL